MDLMILSVLFSNIQKNINILCYLCLQVLDVNQKVKSYYLKSTFNTIYFDLTKISNCLTKIWDYFRKAKVIVSNIFVILIIFVLLQLRRADFH